MEQGAAAEANGRLGWGGLNRKTARALGKHTNEIHWLRRFPYNGCVFQQGDPWAQWDW